jgi:predicted dehydrogenase
MMRALVVGYGSIARRHIANLRAMGGQEFLVYRPSGRPDDAPRDLRFVQHLADAINAKPDFAVIASPSARHIDALVPLLEGRVPCYVEKPPVTTMDDVRRVRQLLDRHPVATMTGCNLRFLPSLRRLRDTIRAGTIGTPVRAVMQAGQWLPDWRPGTDYRRSYSAHAAAGGGVLFDLIHEIDAARWLFGEYDDVHSFIGKFSRLEIDSEDTASVLLSRRDGPIVSINLDYVARQRMRRYEVIGDEATLAWDLTAPTLTLTSGKGTVTLTDSPEDFDIARTYASAMAEFLGAVRGGGATSQDLADGLATTELTLRARH